MTTLTITINEKTERGKNLLSKLTSSPDVSVIKKVKSTPATKRKVNTRTPSNSDAKLLRWIKSAETGELVDKNSVIDALARVAK